MDLFLALVENPACHESFEARSLPTILTALKDSSDKKAELQATALDMLTGLIKFSGYKKLPSAYIVTVFPVVIDLLLKTDEQELLQVSQTIVKAARIMPNDVQHLSFFPANRTALVA